MVVHPVSRGVSRVPRYSGNQLTGISFRLRVSHPLWMAFPYHSANLSCRCAGPQPRRINPPVWPLPISLATTFGISVDVFSSPYLDVSVQAVPPVHLWIQYTVTGLPPAGFPHSGTHGSLPAFGYPWLFADCCALLRLPVPRHPPCALLSLTGVFLHCFAMLQTGLRLMVASSR